ncbi:hypothetical protein [Bacteroides sp. 224]|uniref:hypothetical protein n=1 Tax=Bacteroides sp. 224 TaxID=2302936 RepID=UPI0013D41A0C|nr:hypothetical protein [Bacteroides sp. 224]NDV65039.1 hypothetical protein [Bacteroides sp. 224]
MTLINNPIANTRRSIDFVVRKLISRLEFEDVTVEEDLNECCTVFVDIAICNYDSYPEMEITAVEVIKDGKNHECSLPNIADYIGGRLDAAAKRMNAEELN